jgi:hypothetical protein
MTDPFVVLGLPPTASVEEIRAARRRLARDLHPDVGGDTDAMRAINTAVDAAVAHATGRRPVEQASPPRSPAAPTPGPVHRQAQVDEWSFVVEALPVEAFELLLLVTASLGEVLVDDPPYLLEVHLREPSPCWCRLTLVPDAGSSTVSLVVAPVEVGATAPSIEDVRDLWVGELNRL